MVDIPDGVVTDLRDEVGDALRVVARYDRDGYHLLYCRDDVTERATDRAPPIHDELVLQGVGRDHLESLFEAGSLHCSAHRFDDLTAFHFLASEYTGLFVSIDGDANVRLASLSETCREYLDTE